jgi:hypothetical protein
MWKIGGRACLAAAVVGFLCAWSGAASAMQAYIVGDQLVLTGQVVDSDAEQVQRILASSTVTTVILRNSPGGDSSAGTRIAEMLRQRGLGTAVSGYCYSVCGRIFLGGRTRQFTDDYAPEYTTIGFHGYYEGTALDPAMVQRLDLRNWYIRYSDGKADTALIDRWLSLPNSSGVVRFYNPARVSRGGASTFLCQGNETDVESCEHLRETALDVGIVTSLDLVHSADMAWLRRMQVANLR